jgi:hypothetical protein
MGGDLLIDALGLFGLLWLGMSLPSYASGAIRVLGWEESRNWLRSICHCLGGEEAGHTYALSAFYR